MKPIEGIVIGDERGIRDENVNASTSDFGDLGGSFLQGQSQIWVICAN
jgi:hypothetical protein